jgi:hypothetical protein
MFMTGARMPLRAKKLFTERNLYLLLHNFVHKVFSDTFMPSILCTPQVIWIGIFFTDRAGGESLIRGWNPASIYDVGHWALGVVSCFHQVVLGLDKKKKLKTVHGRAE